MVVKGDIFKLKLFLVAILVDEGRVKLTLTFRAETLDLDLLGEIHPVGRKSFEDGFLGAPIDRQLLVPLVIIKVIDLVLGKSLALHGGEVTGQGLDVYSDILVVIQDDSDIFIRVCDAYVGDAVLQLRFSVIMVAQIDLLSEQLAEKRPYRKPLLTE